ncbi:acyl carrier protein [Streptomyces sp. NPDC127092]|uniref:acyl carrier protein n=1 Tax=Streptomyces sp. NPDC127092 TaxID=3347135 RepID=UPI0036647389
MKSDAAREHALIHLEAILREVWDEHPGDAAIDRTRSFLDLGVDSLTLMILLDRVESEFQVDWDPERPPTARSSLLFLAESVTVRE